MSIPDHPETLLYFGGIAISFAVGNGYAENWETVGGGEFAETANGDTFWEGPTYKRKFTITISCSSDSTMHDPGLDAIQAGEIGQMDSCRFLAATIPAGQTQCVLSRPPVPGSVFVLGPEREQVPFTRAGRVVTIAAPLTYHLAVHFRPRLTFVWGDYSGSAVDGAAKQDWKVIVREKKPPQ